MPRILVTGGAGFIGSHICKSLLDEGHEVICVDNFYTGQKTNLFELLDNKNFEIIRHDICTPLYLEVDQIFNLACPASPIHYQHDPIQTTKTSFLGAFHMLGLAKRLNASILQASTSEVYGNPNISPQVETYWGNTNPIGPRACYDEGKRCAESLFFDYNRKHETKIKVARIFNTYGPNMSVGDGRVVGAFICQALRGDEITIFGDGSQTRSFCYVSDQVRGLRALMNSPVEVTGPVNIGNTEEISVKKLAEIIISLTGSRSKIVYQKLPQDDPIQRRPDISYAEKILDWVPRVPLNEGLQHTISFFEKKLEKDLKNNFSVS